MNHTTDNMSEEMTGTTTHTLSRVTPMSTTIYSMLNMLIVEGTGKLMTQTKKFMAMQTYMMEAMLLVMTLLAMSQIFKATAMIGLWETQLALNWLDQSQTRSTIMMLMRKLL